MRRARLWTILSALSVLGAGGCKCCGWYNRCNTDPGYPKGAVLGPTVPGPLPPGTTGPSPFQPGTGSGSAEVITPAPLPPGAPSLPRIDSNYRAVPRPNLRPPTDEGPIILPPNDPLRRLPAETGPPPLAPTTPPSGGRSLPPALGDPSKGPPAASPVVPALPTPALPVGIGAFADVMAGVSAGQRPQLDGLDWLKTNGYRTVLNLRRPTMGESDRTQIEKRGLQYRELQVSPETIGPALLDEFSRAIEDAAFRPLFVYDRDGTLAGLLWYLHFRTAGKLDDEAARTRAVALGLRESGNEEVTQLWLAAQKFLANR